MIRKTARQVCHTLLKYIYLIDPLYEHVDAMQCVTGNLKAFSRMKMFEFPTKYHRNLFRITINQHWFR